MKTKILSTLAILLIGNSGFASQPEIWWATEVSCNAFMEHLSVNLQENWVNGAKDSYKGTGIKGYDSYEFPSCHHNDNTIQCTGTSQTGKSLDLTIARRDDGTFYGLLKVNNAQPHLLGCLLSR